MIVKLSEVVEQREKKFSYKEKSIEGLNLLDSIQIDGKVVYSDDRYLVEGTYETTLELDCVRCLTKIFPVVKGRFSGIYLDIKSYEKYISELKLEEEIGELVEVALNNEINISNLVREYLILDISEHDRCKPSCVEINEIERYSENEIDPRWQQLLEIKF